MPSSAPLEPARLEALLASQPLWEKVEWVASTGSTNADLAARARSDAETGVVRISEEQTAGRGRFDRRWESPAGACVACSLLLRPSQPSLAWGWLSLLTGMAVATGVERATGAEPGRVQLKWPNDVLLDGKKICGILSERVESEHGAAAVVGFGINVSLEADEIPVPTGTSLRLAGLDQDKTTLMAEILTEFARLYQLWERDGEVHDEYQWRCSSVGAPLRVMVDEQTQVLGTGHSVDEYGRLVVRTPQGLQAFSAGDVFHLRLQQA
ncbi:biotin--[acetyl-CoA-carboxylase] ligase [Luteococcus peritonei]|uniref:biotin--[biotin carboxyl-carrier protein] ligase n=1 Tax=Luteococcus peritonei TaxID=88874 RepID=A0ABW4RYE3_9ACTN